MLAWPVALNGSLTKNDEEKTFCFLMCNQRMQSVNWAKNR